MGDTILRIPRDARVRAYRAWDRTYDGVFRRLQKGSLLSTPVLLSSVLRTDDFWTKSAFCPLALAPRRLSSIFI